MGFDTAWSASFVRRDVILTSHGRSLAMLGRTLHDTVHGVDLPMIEVKRTALAADMYEASVEDLAAAMEKFPSWEVRIPTMSPWCTDLKSPMDSEMISPTFPISPGAFWLIGFVTSAKPRGQSGIAT